MRLFLIIFLLFSTQARAVETLTPMQALSFGSFLVRFNSSIQTVTVPPTGGVSYSPGIMSIVIGNRGIYQLQGFTPSTALSVSFGPQPLTVTCGCGGPDFTVDTFAVFPVATQTDGAGTATVNFGATLRTSGDSAIYNAGPYTGTITMTVIY